MRNMKKYFFPVMIASFITRMDYHRRCHQALTVTWVPIPQIDMSKSLACIEVLLNWDSSDSLNPGFILLMFEKYSFINRGLGVQETEESRNIYTLAPGANLFGNKRPAGF